MFRRLAHLCIVTGGLLAAGLLYAFVCLKAGHGLIPCMFHTVTGLYCPSCGVSRMCLSLLTLNVKTAFKDNAAIMLLIPPGLIIALQMAVRYVKYGITKPTHAQAIVLYIMCGILIMFGILRNIPFFYCLRPEG